MKHPLWTKLALKCCGFLMLGHAATASAMMNTPASWSVSPSGAYTYEMPFRLPPGIAGVQPKVSLEYSSQSGNGTAGMGWGLSGLSAITRCPASILIEGVRGGVNMDANDRLCMDGQRLMLQSGTYGAEGATYSTQQYNGARIVGAAWAGTDHARTFKVHTKAGELMEYAPFNTPANNAALQFVLSRVTDAKGNYWQVHYQTNIAQGEIYPKAICYTGNSRLNQAPKNCVEFGYGSDSSRYGTPGARVDKSLAYMAGFALRNNQRLSGVRTLINATVTASGSSWAVSGTQVTEYKLTYDSTYSANNKTLLKSVQECASATLCLPAQQFAYNENTANLALEMKPKSYDPLYGSSFPSTVHVIPGDFNEDGKVDFVRFYGSSSVHKNYAISTEQSGYTSAAFDSTATEQPFNAPVTSPLVGDFDGDGLTDFLLIERYIIPAGGFKFSRVTVFHYWFREPTGGFLRQAFSEGAEPPTFFGALDISVANVQTGDIDGDAMQELLFEGRVLSAQSRNFVFKSIPGGQRPWLVFHDFTGDGKADNLRFASDAELIVSKSNGDGSFSDFPAAPTTVHGVSTNSRPFIYGDFNGDGKTDFIVLGGASTVKTWLSRGDGTFAILDSAPGQTFDASANNYRFRTGDFNGDGLSDLIQFTSATQTVYWIAKGDGTFLVQPVTTHKEYNSTANYDFSRNDYSIDTADFNGDGKSDLLHLAELPHFRALITAPTNKASLKLRQVKVGNSQTDVEYGHLSGHPNYQLSGAPGAGQVFVRGAAPIVTQIKSSNGIGALQNTQYFKYGNALGESASGRGFLGFAWLENQTVSSDGIAGPLSRSTYSQQWPCTGMLVQSQVKLPSGALQSQVDNTLRVRTPGNASLQTCGTAALNNQVVIPFVSDSTTRQWEINSSGQQGVELPRSKTTTTLDGNGNPTQIQEQTLNPNGSASGYSRTTNNVYDSNAERARQGRLIQSSVTHVKP